MLSIIIVNYKNESKTISFVNNELTKIRTPHITVVVNNEATPESDHKLCDGINAILISDPEFLDQESKSYVISNALNLGFAKANNLGARFSMKHFKINYFLFTNNDIKITDDDIIEKLCEKLDSRDDIGMIGPMIKGPDNELQSPEPYKSLWKKYIWMYWATPFMSTERKRIVFDLNYSEKAKEGVHYMIMGSFFLVKATAFVDCGMMDPNTFLYAEEIILSERLSAIGKKAYYLPSVSVCHEHSQTISKFHTEKSQLLNRFRSDSYYYAKYKNVSLLSIFIGKLSVGLYLKLKPYFRANRSAADQRY